MRPRGASATNYRLPEVLFLLALVKDQLPLGNDEWERVSAKYSETKSAEWIDRDYESLRRKFKALAATKKPTGTAFIPAHILTAKEIKEEIDSKAGVVDLDDNGDDDYVYPGDDDDARCADDDDFEPANAGFWQPAMPESSLVGESAEPPDLSSSGSTTQFTHGLEGFSPAVQIQYSQQQGSTNLAGLEDKNMPLVDEEARRYPSMRARLGGGMV